MSLNINHLSPTVTLTQASLHFGGNLLFQNIQLTLPSNQWTVLLGPSGVGKSSLLRLIAGLNSDAHIASPITTSDGLSLEGRLAYMPQQDLLMPWLSVLDNVLIGAKLRGSKQKKRLTERALFLLNQVGLENVAYKKPSELSGGMRQRVALARTLLEDRSVVLMDEPFSALDVITRLQLQELAAQLLIQRTVLLVTHDPLEALRLGDNVYVMAGRPAILGAALHPAGDKPRALTDPGLLQLQGQLLLELEHAKENTT
ncbi:MAG TPA: ABC transporter ATP-binding protein [Gammaproteobacteria bacterium]|nr:ABC transporter ATP-binding protein [Gammaproteobacteria bacterium]